MIPGIDVSHNNGPIDWNAVAASGIQFAFIKATQGDHYVDPQLYKNMLGVGNAKLCHGYYHYFVPGVDPIAQADWFYDNVGLPVGNELPLVCDFETLNGQPRVDALVAVKVFLEKIESVSACTPILYSNPSFLSQYPVPGGLEKYPLWIAEYGVNAPKIPAPFPDCLFWQYKQSGIIPGIPGMVDLNYFNGTLEELAAL